MNKYGLILLSFLLVSPAYGAQQAAYPTKTTPVAADKILISDSEDGDKAKTTTVTQLGTFIAALHGYPGSGIPVSIGSAWGTSYSLATLGAAIQGTWTGDLLNAITTHATAIQTIASELDNAVNVIPSADLVWDDETGDLSIASTIPRIAQMDTVAEFQALFPDLNFSTIDASIEFVVSGYPDAGKCNWNTTDRILRCRENDSVYASAAFTLVDTLETVPPTISLPVYDSDGLGFSFTASETGIPDCSKFNATFATAGAISNYTNGTGDSCESVTPVYQGDTGTLDGAAGAYIDNFSNESVSFTGMAIDNTSNTSESGAAFLVDSFTEAATTALDLHTPETGGAWSSNAGVPVVTNSGLMNITVGGVNSVIQNAATPSSADYMVTSSFKVNDPGSTYFGGVMGRIAADSSGYSCKINGAGTVSLERRIANGSWGATIGSQAISGFTVGTYYTVNLTMTGSTIACAVEGTSVSLSGTDAVITAAGKAGLFAGGGYKSTFTSISAQ